VWLCVVVLHNNVHTSQYIGIPIVGDEDPLQEAMFRQDNLFLCFSSADGGCPVSQPGGSEDVAITVLARIPSWTGKCEYGLRHAALFFF
jgi:hypothetical protein